MHENSLSLKTLIQIALFSLLIIAFIFLTTFFDSRTKIVFCDVGQGDGIYMRVQNTIDILIDAGPDRKILQCLGKHMPFYDRTIELAIISHPQKDHMGGFLFLFDRYRIEKIFMTPLESTTDTFQEFKQKMYERKSKLYFPKEQTEISFLNDRITFLWPSQKLLSESLIFENTPINQFGVSKLDSNNFSLVFFFQEDNFTALFTGDIPSQTLQKLLYQYNIKTDLLKVPHHGSKNGLTKQFLKLANPTLSVISVGKNNSYGHPSKEVEDLFKALDKNYVRTDEKGDIVLRIKDGKMSQ